MEHICVGEILLTDWARLSAAAAAAARFSSGDGVASTLDLALCEAVFLVGAVAWYCVTGEADTAAPRLVLRGISLEIGPCLTFAELEVLGGSVCRVLGAEPRTWCPPE